ncbi:hypothetical protein [Hirschia baltica]|uniref:Uncharacterized protein n=1 Tax=Hirschia baltica (strain ATCC 49814 / DSM 5838 / IFAM 1418) TaxID=582402 RepID=C6XI92_HIRBI|nr:hypothetical protein [Hirschia baltica]ACT58918.1 hypothetical protein Hbal_1226 [Hirschia baltica ATCC 49814]
MSDDMNQNNSSDDATPMAKLLFGWTQAKSTPIIFLIVLVVISLGLFAADFVLAAKHMKHAYKPVAFSEMPMFYGLYGFAAFAFVVGCGWPLAKLLRKDENYYGDLEGLDADEGDATSKSKVEGE